MSAQEFRAAYTQGRAAAGRGESMTANPYRPEKPPHPLDPPPDPRQTRLANAWLRGWRKGLDEKAQGKR